MPSPRQEPEGVVELSANELHDRLESGEPFTLLDVREPSERAFCAIDVPATAMDRHVPMRQIPTVVSELQLAAVSGPLVVYCHHGVRSMAVAHWLAERGIPNVANLTGGIDAWSIQVDPRVPRYR